jgi:glycerol-3-phosphate acyltransferase PlsX
MNISEAAMKVFLLDLGAEMRGGQRQVLYLASFLARDPELAREFSPVLACPESSPLCRAARDQDIEVFPLKGRRFWNPLVYLQLSAALRCALRGHDGTGHVLLLHTNDAHAASLGAALTVNRAGVLLMHTRRVSYPLHGKGRERKYAGADAVAAVSAEIAAALVMGGVNPDKIRVIHSGIEPDTYRPRINTPRKRLRFALVGALTEQKGHEALLRAMHILKSRPEMPDYEVLAAGRGPLLNKLEALARELGVADRIVFPGQRESRSLLPECDILLSPSSGGEGSNATIKEGWAVGIPVIASDLPSNLELVEPGDSGLVFSVGKAAALAEAMLILAADPALRLLLAGDRAAILAHWPEAEQTGRAEVCHAGEVIGMEEHPAMAFRKKKDASITVAARLVKEGRARGVVSAGSTGAQMVASLFVLGRIKGVERPAIGSFIPTLQGPRFMLDIGANVDSTPENLLQYAWMGRIYAAAALGIKDPAVYLLSNGAEAEKGDERTQKAHQLLAAAQGLRFCGNVEARDLLAGEAEVIVTDGFAGNVALKTMEGTAGAMFALLKAAFTADARSKIGAALLKPALGELKKRLDYEEYGGAPLLGVNGLSVVCHGSSKARAIAVALGKAAAWAESGFLEKLAAHAFV